MPLIDGNHKSLSIHNVSTICSEEHFHQHNLGFDPSLSQELELFDKHEVLNTGVMVEELDLHSLAQAQLRETQQTDGPFAERPEF